MSTSFTKAMTVHSSSDSANKSPRRSSRRSHDERWSRSQRSRARNPAALRLAVRTLPNFSVRTSPLSSSTWRCCPTAVKVISRGAANPETEAGLSISLSTMALRVGSPRASKIRAISICAFAIHTALSVHPFSRVTALPPNPQAGSAILLPRVECHSQPRGLALMLRAERLHHCLQLLAPVTPFDRHLAFCFV